MRVRRALLADLALLAALGVAASRYGVAFVSGGSMRPALSAGDLVVYRRGSGPVASGAMVLLGEPGHRFVHRVVAVTSEGRLVTRGDANPIPDRDTTGTAAVRGRVVGVLPSAGLVGRLASSAGNARLWSQSHSER